MNVTFEQVEEFFDMLKGESLPDSMAMRNPPILNAREAFSVIWFLQEHLQILPDHIEMCGWCNELFDAYCGGHYINEDSYNSDSLFYDGIGVTDAQVSAAAGTHLCSMECESKFWKSGGNKLAEVYVSATVTN